MIRYSDPSFAAPVFATPADQVCAISLTDWQGCGQGRRHCCSFNEPREKSFTDRRTSWAPWFNNCEHPMSLFRLHDFRDRRQSPRHDVQYLAQIDPGGSSAPLSCIICDISIGGAKLTIGTQEVPEEFTLWFRRRCRVARRSDGQIGVQFVHGS